MITKQIPEIRFGDYYEDWMNKSLKSIAEINPKTPLPDKFKYIDLESVVGTQLNSYRFETKESAPSRAQRLAGKGDIFYQTVRPYQKNNYLFNLPSDDYVFSTGYAQLRPSVDSYFLFSKLQDDRFVSKVLDQCTGTSYPAINSGSLSLIKIHIPTNKEEQKKIGSFMRNLDATLSLHQHELTILKQTKQGFLQKMFPKEGATVPEVRFPGFTDAWEQRELGKSGNFVRSSVNPQLTSNDEFVEYSMPAYDNGRSPEIVFGESMQSSRLKISGDVLLINKLNVRQKRIWLVQGAPENAVASSEFMPYTSVDIDLEFLQQLMLSDKSTRDMESMSSGTSNSQKRITPSDFLKYQVMLPIDKEEQRQIGEFLCKLDNLITLQQRELDALKETKKAFLQKMFL